VGGILTTGIGWEWIFFVNVPIGVIAAILALHHLEESKDPDATGADWPGFITFSGSLFLLVFALVQGNESGWGSTKIVAYLIGALVLIVLFLIVERAQKRPMLDLALFRRPAFGGASIVAFTLAASAFSMFLYLTLYIQTVLGYSALQTGLRFLPTTLVMFAVSPIAGQLSVRMPVRLLLGAGLLCISGAMLALTAVSPSSGWTVLIPGFVLEGIGIGLVNPPLASTAVGVVPPARSGMASGINNTFRQVGVATGIAGLGAVFTHQLSSHAKSSLIASGQAREVLAAVHGPLGRALEAGQAREIAARLHPAAGHALHHAYQVAFVDAFTTILWIAAAIAFVGAVAAVALVRSGDFARSEVPVSPQVEPAGAGVA
jgi:predicted MFS family arabinose efflux permease